LVVFAPDNPAEELMPLAEPAAFPGFNELPKGPELLLALLGLPKLKPLLNSDRGGVGLEDVEDKGVPNRV
jgi:hypothetical protein